MQVWHPEDPLNPVHRLSHDAKLLGVDLTEPDGSVRGAVDQAYRDKYGRYGDTYVVPMVGDGAAAATFRLTPAPAAVRG